MSLAVAQGGIWLWCLAVVCCIWQWCLAVAFACVIYLCHWQVCCLAVALGVWHLVLGVWHLAVAFGIWHLVIGCGFGIWHLAVVFGCVCCGHYHWQLCWLWPFVDFAKLFAILEDTFL